MAKKPKTPNITITSDAELQAHIGGKRARRRRQIRRALRVAVPCVLVILALGTGFVMTDALLHVSEQPLPEEERLTAPATTTQPPATARPVPKGSALHPFYVPLHMMDNREQSRQLQTQVAAAQSNAVVMLFKDSGGYLSYKSNLMQQSLLHASERTRWRTDWTLYDMKNRAKQKIIGVIHCFDDPLAAGLITDAAVLLRETEAVPWKDAQGKRWLNPFSEAAREYLLAVIREVRSFGADDILLCGVQFPAGNLEAAVFPGEPIGNEEERTAARNQALRDFLNDAKAAAGGGKLYCMLPAQAALEGAPEYGGTLWDSNVDLFAIDMRGMIWMQFESVLQTRPAIPLVDSAENANGARDYIVLTDENLQARF